MALGALAPRYVKHHFDFTPHAELLCLILPVIQTYLHHNYNQLTISEMIHYYISQRDSSDKMIIIAIQLNASLIL